MGELSQRLRFEILKRDNNTCRYCGARAPEAVLTVDHVVPRALGGSDQPDNLVAACVDCNAGKGSTNPTAEVVADVRADAFAHRERLLEALRNVDKAGAAMEEAVNRFDKEWTAYEPEIPRDRDWATSVKVWLHRLTRGDNDPQVVAAASGILIGLIPRAMRQDTAHWAVWRYYCGCAWGAVRDLEDVAAQLPAPTPVDPVEQIRRLRATIEEIDKPEPPSWAG